MSVALARTEADAVGWCDAVAFSLPEAVSDIDGDALWVAVLSEAEMAIDAVGASVTLTDCEAEAVAETLADDDALSDSVSVTLPDRDGVLVPPLSVRDGESVTVALAVSVCARDALARA